MSDTMLKVYWLPTIKAAMELNANKSTQAVVFLEAATPHDLGDPPQLQLKTLYPVYIGGQAQLVAHNGAAAATEFPCWALKGARGFLFGRNALRLNVGFRANSNRIQ